MAINTLSAKAIENARLKDGEDEVFMRDGDGLELRIRTGGSVWQYRYTFQGKRRVLPICDGGHTAKERRDAAAVARAAAIQYRAWAKPPKASGVLPRDPRDVLEQLANEKRQQEIEQQRLDAESKAAAALAAARLTFNGLFGKWESAILAGRKDQGAETRRSFTKDVFPAIGELYADQVTKAHISSLLMAIVQRGSNRMANRTLTDLKQLFTFACVHGLLENDPTAHFSKSHFGGQEVERDRVLSELELKELLNGKLNTCTLPERYKCAIRLLLATAARVGELMRARVMDFDLSAGTGGIWIIPAEHAKNGRQHTIHLSRYAIEQVQRIVEISTAQSEWLFPSRLDASRHTDTKSLTKMLRDRQKPNVEALQHRAATTDELVLSGGQWTPHDLRRTAATLMGEAGVAFEVVERCLNHVEQNKVARTYQRQELLDDRHRAFTLLGDMLIMVKDHHRPQKNQK